MNQDISAPITPGGQLLAALRELHHEHRTAGRHSAAHAVHTVQARLTEEDAQRVLEILLTGFKRQNNGLPDFQTVAEAALHIASAAPKPLHVIAGGKS